MTSPVFDRSWWINRWSILAIIVILVAGWFVYRPALSGSFLLDDLPNLGDLTTVTDQESALHFVFSGIAGPLGRPIALASFVPQASAMGSNAEPFIRINIFIHLLNGLLVFALARTLGRFTLVNQRDLPLLALGVTAIWLFMPLLASSSLLIVQRMTTLSATFVLAGLIAYLIARRRLETGPNTALVFMSLTLILATLLATFTKENGALLPLYVLVLEATILSPPKNLPKLHWNIWRALFLGLPALIIVVFLLLQIPYTEDMIARREFTASERLFSQAQILWRYLFNALFVQSGQLGPFHDWRPVRGLFAAPWTIIAITAWIVVLAGALLYRRRYPVAAFAALWFLAGHLLESTTIPLELYFEHRNYLPVIGPVFALGYWVFRVNGRYRIIMRAALVAYVTVNATILFGVTSMWGQPLHAATYWHERNPGSVRAATTLAAQQLSSTGPSTAMNTLREFARGYPQHAYVRIPELNLACTFRPDDDHSALIEYLKSELASVAYMPRTGEMLDQLLSASITSDCESISPAIVADLAASVLRNPRYSRNVDHNQFHQMLMARIARDSGDIDQTLAHLYRAIEYKPSDDLNMMTVTTLVAADRFEEARHFIDDAANHLPDMPLKRYNSKRNLDELMTYVNEAEKLEENQGAPIIGD